MIKRKSWEELLIKMSLSIKIEEVESKREEEKAGRNIFKEE